MSLTRATMALGTATWDGRSASEKTISQSPELSSVLDKVFMVCLILSVPTMPFFRVAIGSFLVPMEVPIVLAYACLKIVGMLSPGSYVKVRPGISVLLALFLLWAGTSLLWASSPRLAFPRFIELGYEISFVGLAINYCRLGRASLVRFGGLFAIVTMAPLLVGYYGFFASDAYWFQFVYDVPGAVGDRNSDAFMALTTLTFGLSLLFSSARMGAKWRLVGVLTTIAAGGAVFLSLSRASLIIGVILFSFMALAQVIAGRARLTAVASIAVVVISVTCLASLVPVDRADRLYRDWHTRIEDVDTDRRWIYDGGAWLLASRYPLTGVGLNNFGEEFRSTNVGRTATVRYSPHNSYLGMLSELGLPGLSLFILVIFWPLFMHIKLSIRVIRSKDPISLQLLTGGIGLSILLILPLLAYSFDDFSYYWIVYVLASLISLELERSTRGSLDNVIACNTERIA